MKEYNYGTAILAGFEFLLENYNECFVIGQGLWSPWYVGNSMTDLDKKYGTARVIDTPVSESACTGAGVGASLAGMKPIVVHPRMDFMLYAMDAIVNQAAKWNHMVGGQASPGVTIRSIINRGGQQGAQHSQALHAWFAHVPGLRVVMPANVADARDMLIAAVLCPDPVIYIDDRWLYELVDELHPPEPNRVLTDFQPQVIQTGSDITLVASGYSVELAKNAAAVLASSGVAAEVIDQRVLNPFDSKTIENSVMKTGRILAIDGGWATCGISAEICARIAESPAVHTLKAPMTRITLPDAPAPSAGNLETSYYPNVDQVIARAMEMTN